MPAIEDLIMKVITDRQFAEKLLANPEMVLTSEGISPTPEMLDVLKNLDAEELSKMASQFDAGNIAM